MTVDQQQTFDTFLRVLNEAVAADAGAIQDLLGYRVSCNGSLGNHPTIQVKELAGTPRALVVGALGLINGLVEATTGERIAGVYSDDGWLEGFIQYQRQ